MRWNVYKTDPDHPLAVNLIGEVDADCYTAAVKAAVVRWPRLRDLRQRNDGFRVVRTDAVVMINGMLRGPMQ